MAGLLETAIVIFRLCYLLFAILPLINYIDTKLKQIRIEFKNIVNCSYIFTNLQHLMNTTLKCNKVDA